jgi:hypothetical protein
VELGSEHQAPPRQHLERIMEFISTTATAVEKLKRQAKTLRKSAGGSLAKALDTVAQDHGYLHWKHVIVCLEQTKQKPLSKSLPDALKDVLDRVAQSNPASSETLSAFAHGLVFAMDVKDAEQLKLTSDYIECDDGWYLAAHHIWPKLVHERHNISGTTLAETLSPEKLVSTALDDVSHYRFFRYTGLDVPSSLEEAYKRVQALCFYPPTHVWIKGSFINVADVPEIRLDGEVVFSSVQGVRLVTPNDKRTRIEKFGHLLNEKERALFDTMTPENREAWLFELEKRTSLGRSRYRSVSTTADVKWRGAKQA